MVALPLANGFFLSCVRILSCFPERATDEDADLFDASDPVDGRRSEFTGQAMMGSDCILVKVRSSTGVV